MSGAKEIRTKIKSIKNTQKITKAMEMVAASKMRKAKDRMQASKPYARKIKNVIGHLLEANPEYQHPFFEEREVKRVGLIIISSDRGLCGGLNTNLFKKAFNQLNEWNKAGIEYDLCLIGAKANSMFKRMGNIVATTSHLGDKPELNDLVGPLKIMLDAYEAGTIDHLYLAENEFVNSMTQNPMVNQLIPLPPSDDELAAHTWDYIYEPSAQEVLESLLTRYIESQLYQAVVENVACEMSSRMVAMKSASDNAADIIDELQLVYNKARQAAITQEISEIVGGAAAV